MNNDLAPAYKRLFSPYWVLWYSTSNNYSVVESEFKMILDVYFDSNSLDEFSSKLAMIDSKSDASVISWNIENYLQACNLISKPTKKNTPKFKASFRNICRQYKIKNKKIKIFFDSKLVEKTIHPSIAHLKVKNNTKAEITFDIYLEEDFLCLFINEKLITSIPKRDYHLLQGKFFMELISLANNKVETDWLGTFHGSTIADGRNSILIIGKSGKGKSTLCALLAANGYELVADDVSPMLSRDLNIYRNHSALSIKQGAFNRLKNIIDGFENLPTTYFNKSKGLIKHVPFEKPKKDHYPCKAIVMVNYKDESETTLDSTSIKKVLETLIPDSWLSPNQANAKQFIDWLEQSELYQLTYSDTKSVINRLSVLFDELRN
ncbi:hypothetical protein [Winogradskyella flava]|uniref:hypothetical protein n=1 Tax=Winogradskyella flava TaxID=1884876 RepID=UPI002492BE6D|nr:hypothetical protein [Winogradskyella flava]